MNVRTRYFIIASTLLTTIGVGTALVAYYVGFPPAEYGAGAAELRLVPSSAPLVAYVNVHELMGSELRRRASRLLEPREARRREFEAATGINVETDIDHVVACLDGSGITGNVPQGGLVIASGRFNETKIEALMREHGAGVDDYKGKRLIVIQPPAHEDGTVREPLAVALVQPGLVAAGKAQLVRSAVDLQQGGDSLLANHQMMRLISPLAGSTAWAVGRVDVLRQARQVRLLQPLNDQLSGMTWFSLSSRASVSLDGTLRVEARDEPTASALRDVARGLVTFVKLRAAADARAAQSSGLSLEIGGTGFEVALSFSIPAEVLDAIPGVPPGR